MLCSCARFASTGTSSLLDSFAFAVPTEGDAATANVNALIARYITHVAAVAVAADADNQPYGDQNGGRSGERGGGKRGYAY